MTGIGQDAGAGEVTLPDGAAGDAVPDAFTLGDRDLTILRPRNPDAVLDDLIASGAEGDERLPFWSDLWPSGTALARAVAQLNLNGVRVLELGCGLGLVSVAAAMAGASVLAADWSPEAIAFTRANAARNHVDVRTVRCAFDQPDALLAEAPWELVLAADVLYEPQNTPALLWLLPRLIDTEGEIWVADPGRNQSTTFLTVVDAAGWDRTSVPTHPDDSPKVTIHRLRCPAASADQP